MANNTKSVEKKHMHEPLLHISKRDSLKWWQSWLVRVIAVIVALIISAIVTLMITGKDPIAMYVSMVEGSFGTTRRIWKLLQDMAILLCVSLAVTPAFKMKFWNIGAEGQVLIGGLVAATWMFTVGDRLSNWQLITLMVISCILAGAIWGIIPSIFKAFWNTNETLFTLMMNYIATQLVAFFRMKWDGGRGTGIGIINSESHSGWIPKLAGQQYLVNIIVVAVITALMYVYLKYSKQGYEISVVGESENTARYIGINVKKVIIRTMAISGAICGIAGFLLVSGTDHTISTTTAGGRGFTAIMVSWLAKFNPIYMILTTFLLVFLQIGAGKISTEFRLNEAFSDIITGIILFFIIGSEFFINYKVVINRNFFGRKAQIEETSWEVSEK